MNAVKSVVIALAVLMCMGAEAQSDFAMAFSTWGMSKEGKADAYFVRACDKAITERLKAPGSYRRDGEPKVRRKRLAPDEVWEEYSSLIEANIEAKGDEGREYWDKWMLARCWSGGREGPPRCPDIRLVSLFAYSATNPFGVRLRGHAICSDVYHGGEVTARTFHRFGVDIEMD